MNLSITLDDSIPQQAGPGAGADTVTPQQIVEAIARQWDDCMTTIEDRGEVDIGAEIRSDGVPHQFRSSHLAAPLAVEDSRERDTDALIHALAECRDAFQIPAPGEPLDNLWQQAMGDPLCVPAFVRAAMAAASSGKEKME